MSSIDQLDAMVADRHRIILTRRGRWRVVVEGHPLQGYCEGATADEAAANWLTAWREWCAARRTP